MQTKMNSNLKIKFKLIIKRITCSLICIFAFAFVSNAVSVITFPENQLKLKSDVEYLIDSNSSLTFNNVLSNQLFKRVEGSFINLAYQKNGCWFRFSFIAKQHAQNYILSIENPLLDNITFYCKKNNSA